MPGTLDPFRLLLFAVTGWMNHQQQQILDYLREENRILHAQLGTRRLPLEVLDWGGSGRAVVEWSKNWDDCEGG